MSATLYAVSATLNKLCLPHYIICVRYTLYAVSSTLNKLCQYIYVYIVSCGSLHCRICVCYRQYISCYRRILKIFIKMTRNIVEQTKPRLFIIIHIFIHLSVTITVILDINEEKKWCYVYHNQRTKSKIFVKCLSMQTLKIHHFFCRSF